MSSVGYIVWDPNILHSVITFPELLEKNKGDKWCSKIKLLSPPALLFCAITVLWLLYNLYFHIISKQSIIFPGKKLNLHFWE